MQSAPQRRGPSGPMNTSGGRPSTPLPSGGAGRGGPTPPTSSPLGKNERRSGGVPNQRGGWEDEESGWTGNGAARGSRTMSAPPGRPGQGTQSGRVGQTGQWGGANGRVWDAQDDEDDGWGGRGRQQRPPSGQMGAAARGGQARTSGPARGGTTTRGNWVVENDAKGGSSSGNPLRRRLLVLLLVAVVALGGIVVLVPSVRHRVECYLPGASSASSACNTAAQATIPVTPGTLVIQVNVPGATVKVDNQTQTAQAGQAGAFPSATFKNLTTGNHTLTVQATNFTDFTGPLTLPAGGATVTAWLAPSQPALTNAGNQFAPATQPDGGVAGDHYAVGKPAATGKISVNISYQISGWPNTSPFTSQVKQSADTKTSPFTPAALALVPVIKVTSAAGTTLYTSQYQALPTTQFGVQLIPTVDAKGNVQLSVQGIVLKAGGQDVKTSFAGPSGSDYALFYALASVLPATPPNALNFTCVGAVDNQNFNPEDGLFITENGGAHYFYRWGLLWATNTAAHTLTPNAPRTQFGLNEFTDATNIENYVQAHPNANCGSAG
jgi:hypothetical protein